MVLGPFEKFRKATISFVMSVRPTASNNSAPNGRNVMKFYISVFFECLYRKIQFHWNLIRVTGNLHKKPTYNHDSILLNSSSSDKSFKVCKENQKTHFMLNIFSQKSCRLWDNVEKYDKARQATDDNIIRCLCIACWVTEAADIHSEFVILLLFHSNGGYASMSSESGNTVPSASKKLNC
jgi:hypothetical protein